MPEGQKGSQRPPRIDLRLSIAKHPDRGQTVHEWTRIREIKAFHSCIRGFIRGRHSPLPQRVDLRPHVIARSVRCDVAIPRFVRYSTASTTSAGMPSASRSSAVISESSVTSCTKATPSCLPPWGEVSRLALARRDSGGPAPAAC